MGASDKIVQETMDNFFFLSLFSAAFDLLWLMFQVGKRDWGWVSPSKNLDEMWHRIPSIWEAPIFIDCMYSAKSVERKVTVWEECSPLESCPFPSDQYFRMCKSSGRESWCNFWADGSVHSTLYYYRILVRPWVESCNQLMEGKISFGRANPDPFENS